MTLGAAPQARPRRVLAAGLLAACALFAISACSSKDKPKPHKAADLVRIEKPAFHVEESWSHSIGSGADGLVLNLRVAAGEDAIYTASENGEVDALDPKTGRRLWHVKLKKTRLSSGPSIDGGLILLGSLDAEVIALRRASGELAWRVKLSDEIMAPPVGDGNMVVVRSIDGRVYGISANDGSKLWNFDRNEPALALRGLSAPLIVDNRVYLGLDNGRVVALELGSGQLAWDQALSLPTGRTELERIADIDADLLPGADGLFAVSYGADLALINPQSGQSLWRRTVKSYTGMAVDGERLFVTDDDGNVWALDTATGAQVWKQSGLQYRFLSPPAVLDGKVVVGDYKGYLHFLAEDDGHFLARYRFHSDPIRSPPVAAGNLLYVMNVHGKLGAIGTRPK